MDANFRLNNKLTDSKDRTDRNLTDGCAYMAPKMQYDAYIRKTEGQKDAEPVSRLFRNPFSSYHI